MVCAQLNAGESQHSILWFLGALFLVLGVCGPLGMSTLNNVAFQLTAGLSPVDGYS